MTWEILTGLIIVVGCLISLGGVLARLVRAITRLEVTLAAIDKSVAEDKSANAAEHKEFRGELTNHEIRITGIEKERKG